MFRYIVGVKWDNGRHDKINSMGKRLSLLDARIQEVRKKVKSLVDTAKRIKDNITSNVDAISSTKRKLSVLEAKIHETDSALKDLTKKRMASSISVMMSGADPTFTYEDEALFNDLQRIFSLDKAELVVLDSHIEDLKRGIIDLEDQLVSINASIEINKALMVEIKNSIVEANKALSSGLAVDSKVLTYKNFGNKIQLSVLYTHYKAKSLQAFRNVRYYVYEIEDSKWYALRYLANPNSPTRKEVSEYKKAQLDDLLKTIIVQ